MTQHNRLKNSEDCLYLNLCHRKTFKEVSRQALTKRFLLNILFFIILTNPLPTLAAQPQYVKSAYFNSADSVVLELKTSKNTQISNLEIKKLGKSKYLIPNFKLSNHAKANLLNDKYLANDKVKIVFENKKTQNRSWYKLTDAFQIEIISKSINENIKLESRALVPGHAYELSFLYNEEAQDSVTNIIGIENSNLRAVKEIQTPETHQLKASSSIGTTQAIPFKPSAFAIIDSHPSKTEEFIQSLDRTTAALLKSSDYKSKVLDKADAASLTAVADALVENGKSDDAINAFRKAIEIDPGNYNAKLGLARVAKDDEEKLVNYLETIHEDALLNISQLWFQRGLENKDAKRLSQALISYQLLILKNNSNPVYRLEYAKALEKSGGDYFAQAPKRYLEAAILSKKQYLSGDRTIEKILRAATENLIRVLTLQGQVDSAVKYCNSYKNLGFNKFTNGRSIAAVKKEISVSKNPFKKG